MNICHLFLLIMQKKGYFKKIKNFLKDWWLIGNKNITFYDILYKKDRSDIVNNQQSFKNTDNDSAKYYQEKIIDILFILWNLTKN